MDRCGRCNGWKRPCFKLGSLDTTLESSKDPAYNESEYWIVVSSEREDLLRGT